MASTVRKGSLLELKAKKILEAEGYLVHKTVRSSYRGAANDVLGCVDIIAKKAGERTRWIQVTTKNVSIGRKIKDLEEVPWTPEHDSVEVWQWMGIPLAGNGRVKWAESQKFRVRKRDCDWSIKEADTEWDTRTPATR